MNWKTTIPFVLLMGLIAFVYFDLNKKINNSSTTAVIDMERLYLSFEMTKTLEKKYALLTKNKGAVMDSLNRVVKTLQSSQASNDPTNEVNQKIQKVLSVQASLHQNNEQAKLELEQQIWNQLNPYLLQFGQQTGYDIILGAMGQGNVIYVSPPIDATDEAIEFINNKYRGIN